MRAKLVEPELVDETLEISEQMRMTLGKAFPTGDRRTAASRGFR